jgi:hypothetical protein
VQDGCPEFLPLGERTAVQDDHVGSDPPPAACPDPDIHVVPGELKLVQLAQGDDLMLASGQLAKRR